MHDDNHAALMVRVRHLVHSERWSQARAAASGDDVALEYVRAHAAAALPLPREAPRVVYGPEPFWDARLGEAPCTGPDGDGPVFNRATWIGKARYGEDMCVGDGSGSPEGTMRWSDLGGSWGPISATMALGQSGVGHEERSGFYGAFAAGNGSALDTSYSGNGGDVGVEF